MAPVQDVIFWGATNFEAPHTTFRRTMNVSRDVAIETGKMFNALKLNTIPVVFRGANYSQILPPGSYIDALDFPDPKGSYCINCLFFSIVSVFSKFNRLFFSAFHLFKTIRACGNKNILLNNGTFNES